MANNHGPYTHGAAPYRPATIRVPWLILRFAIAWTVGGLPCTLWADKAPASKPAPLGVGAKEVARLRGSGNSFVSFSADGSLILTASDTEVRAWDARTFKPVMSPLKCGSPIQILQLLDNGRSAFVLTEKDAFSFSARTGRRLVPHFGGAGLAVWPAAVSPDGSKVVLGIKPVVGETNAELYIFDAASGKPLHSLRHTAAPEFAVFSPDGGRLVSAEPVGFRERKFHLWDVKTARELCDPITTDYGCDSEPFSGCAPAAFSPDGHRLAIASASWFSIHDGLTGKPIVGQNIEYAAGPSLESVEFTPDGGSVVAIQSGRVVLADSATTKPRVEGIDILVSTFSLSPDGNRIACPFTTSKNRVEVGHGVSVWNLSSRKEEFSLSNDRGGPVAFSPDGHRVAAAGGGAESRDTLIWQLPR